METKKLKFWLDDCIQPPDDSWTWFDSSNSIINTLRHLNKKVYIISLDHDLGNESIYGTGYDVMKWIEEQVYTNSDFILPIIIIHSRNPVGADKMKMSLNKILKRYLKK
jgi:hypothetical protein